MSFGGFTLIEVLVSTVILGVGVVGLMSAATLGLRNSQRAEFRTSAMNLAREKMAEIEVVGAHLWMLGKEMSGNEPRGRANYEWTIDIDQLEVGELFDVKVTVNWQASAGSGSVVLEGLLNDYEASAIEQMDVNDKSFKDRQKTGQKR